MFHRAVKKYRAESSQVKSSHLYLYSAFNKTNCVKATAQYKNRNFFELKAFHYWFQWCHCPAQLSLNSICAIKSVISLEMKCPQLSKPEATTARNQNSIGDRTEKKTLGETRLSWGASSPLARWTSSLFQLQKSQSVRAPLVPVVFSRWLSRWRGPDWRSVSGAHLGALVSTDIQSWRGSL